MKALLRICMVCVCVSFAGIASAQAITATALQHLLQDAPQRDARFTETRESPWLQAPVEASGTMTSTAAALEKRVEHPRRETWRIMPDRMELVAADGARKEFRFDQVPAIAALANATRHVMAGDLQALQKDFRVTLNGDEREWTVQLKPRDPEVTRYLKQLELQGSRGRLQVIIIEESRGDRTTTRLAYE